MLSFEELPEVNSERWLSLENLEGEIWLPVVGYEELYSVSNYGRVRREVRKKKHSRAGYATLKRIILRQYLNMCGYWMVGLKKVGVSQRTITVHILVARAFIENTHNYPQIDHIDSNRRNNTVTNLRFCTAFQNKHNPLSEINCYIKGIIPQGKPVVLLDSFGNYITDFWGVNEASRNLGIRISICSAALCHTNKNILCKGYQLVYKDKYDKEKDYFRILKQTSTDYKGFVPHEKIVIAFDNNMNIKRLFYNQIEAGKYYNVNQSQISRRCSFNNDPQKAKKKFVRADYNGDYLYQLGDLKGEIKNKVIEYIKRNYKPYRAELVQLEKPLPKMFL